jgi:AcrR family transcriptional regulator
MLGDDAATTQSRSVDRRIRRRETKTAAIVTEAWELARRDGLGGISLRDLADRVDLAQPSLYSYFGSKLDLYDAMFADGNRQLIETVTTDPFDSDPRQALIEFVERIVAFSSADVVRHELLFQRTVPGFEPSSESYAVAQAFLDIGIALLSAAGITDPSDVDLFTALCSGLGHQQVANDPGGTRWVVLASRAVDLLLAGATGASTSRPLQEAAR